jgi:hypothetical protein
VYREVGTVVAAELQWGNNPGNKLMMKSLQKKFTIVAVTKGEIIFIL